MTRLPHENRDVEGIAECPEFPRYTVSRICSVPSCSMITRDIHHIWRRSFVIGDKPWVRLWDGTITGNLTGLCAEHHRRVTENVATISWEFNQYWWVENTTDAESGWNGQAFQLNPQPPIWGRTEYDDSSPQRDEEKPHEHVGPGAVERCDTCHRPLPRPQEKREGPRARKDWKITVPVDERENGADILDTLLQECAVIFGHDETKGARYFTVVQALALVVQNKEKFLADS